MEAGVFGANGANALNRVAVDGSTAQGPVPGLPRPMVVNYAVG